MNNFSKEKLQTGFTQVPNHILQNPKTTAKAKWLHCYLLSRPDNWVFYMSEIEKNTKDGRGVIESAMKELIDAGYVIRTSQRDNKGRFKNYHYHIRYNPLQVSRNGQTATDEPQRIDRDGKSATNNTEDTNTHLTNTDSTNKDTKDISLSDDKHDPIMQEFEEWYELYNKKKDKKGAITKFKAARKKHTFEQIMNGTRNYLKTITDKQYQKYPKTFLHNESYLDDYSDDIKEEVQTDSIFDRMRERYS